MRFALLISVLLVLAGCGGGGGDTGAKTPVTPNAVQASFTVPTVVTWAQGGALSGALTTDGYVDDATCVECHTEQHRSYQSVSMCNSFKLPEPDAYVESFEDTAFYHPASDRHYEVVLRGDDMVVRRWQVDDAGTTYNEREETVDYIVGSGAHTRSYLYRTESGELFQMPVAWFTVTQSWGIHPGYDTAEHAGFNRPITRDCIACHTSYPTAPVGSDMLGQPHIYPENLPLGIGCQRCHGPGAAHVEIANDPNATVESILATVVRISELDPERRNDVCLQCHMQPASMHASRIQREGRGSYSFRPGERLEDFSFTVAFGDAATQQARFESNHHPVRIDLSLCREPDGGPLMCVTCHDPHMDVPPADASTYFNATCLSCHGADDCGLDEPGPRMDHPVLGDVAVDDCITCHMPKRRPHDVVGVIMTDHRISRHPPSRDLTGVLRELPSPVLEPSPYYDRERDEALTELFMAIAASHERDPAGADALRDAIDEHAPDAIDAYAHLGTALVAADRFADADAHYATMVGEFPDVPTVHTEHGRVLEKLDRPEDALEAYERSISLGSNAPENYVGLAAAYYRLGQPDAAIACLHEAIRLRPNFADAHFSLAVALHRADDSDGALAAYRETLSIDPRHHDAALYLGMLEFTRGDNVGAAKTWHRAHQEHPQHPTLAEAHAVGLMLTGRGAEALQQLDIAAAIGADPVVCYLVAAVVHTNEGRRDIGAQALAAANDTVAQMPQGSPLRNVLRRVMTQGP